MLIILIAVSMAHTCEQALHQRLNTDLKQKTISFLDNQGGLDSVTEYPECMVTPSSTYTIIHWKKNSMYYVHYGFCLPQTCTEQISHQIISSFIESNNFTNLISNEGFEIHFFPYKSPAIEIHGIFFFSCFMLMLLCGLIGTVFNYNLKNSVFWQAFSITSNFKKLLYLSSSEGTFQFFDGIRAISSLLIVTFHVVFFSMAAPLTNRSEFLDLQKGSLFNSMLTSAYAVDVFFFMAGVLVVVNILAEIRRKDGRVNWVFIILRRIIRYYPVYLFVIGFDCLTHGLPPASSQILPTYNHVKVTVQDWAKSIVFMHAILPKERLLYLSWTWTTASDFYLFILSCFIINVYAQKKSFAYLIILALLLLTTIYTLVISYIHNLSTLFINNCMSFYQMFKIYYHPITRAPPYLIGNIVGFIYLSSKKNDISVAYEVKDELVDRFERRCLEACKSKLFRGLIYTVGFGILAFLNVGPILLGLIGEDKSDLYTNAAFLGFQRTLAGLAFALISLPMILGYYNWLQRFLSLKIFGPFAKLSYAIYNIHIIVFFIVFLSGNNEKKWTWSMIANNIAILYPLTILVSAFVQVLIESPIFSLERKLFR